MSSKLLSLEHAFPAVELPQRMQTNVVPLALLAISTQLLTQCNACFLY